MVDNKSQENKSNNLENLKALASVYNSNQINLLISEIKKARQVIENLEKRANDKLSTFAPKEVKVETPSKPEKVEIKEVKEEKPRQNFGQRTFSSNQFGKPNFENRQGGFNKPNGFRSQNGGKQFGDKKPFGNKPNGFNKPFNNNGKPGFFKRNQEPEIDINSLVKDQGNRTFGNKKKSHEEPFEHKQMNRKAQMRFNVADEDDEDEDRLSRRYKSRRKAEVKVEQQITVIDHAVITSENMTVKDFSEKIGKPVAEIVKKLFILGIIATINSKLDYETAELVASDFGITLEKNIQQTQEQLLEEALKQTEQEDEKFLTKRPPVITVMGHVDHGKTSLLDAIRKTNVVSGEAGGITQSIGAYTVKIKGESITFIDTPGHAAFTAMRARGAQLTDIAILVVAADDGVMPQTIEAIHHIKDAKVPMIVAINKMDKPEANPDRVKQELADNEVLCEEWGGDTICVPIAAKKGENIDKLLEMVLLVAEMQNLKANPSRKALGTVIEAKLDKGKGPVASILVQNGTLKVGDTVVSGIAFGRIRAMLDEHGKTVMKAGPSTPVSVLGLDEVPSAGDSLMVVDEKQSRLLIEERKNKIKEEKTLSTSAVSLEEFMNKAKEGSLKNLNVIIKADVQGSAEALKASILKIKNEEVKVSCVHAGVGAISESDVLLAQASKSLIVGFNTKPEAKAKTLAEREGIEIRTYSIIYECIEDLEAAIHGMMAPKYKEVVLGRAEVRKVFNLSSSGIIAGSYVLDGKITRNAYAKVIRNGETIFDTSIIGLKIQKDEVKEATKTFECGIKLENFDDIKELDVIEAYTKERIN
ncbi:MAG: translation initiation factor IF-2 [Clostridiales bacterium]|nr:translation initiation factor IF-2 [Candidatus Apopatousia equi]